MEARITKGGIREINTSEKHELVTTHTARRSLATNLVLRGVSPYVVMKVTGHRSLSSDGYATCYVCQQLFAALSSEIDIGTALQYNSVR
ncbi:MAG: hypothetical protein DRJ13_11750 [Bacteroidetes bacterium]|nr:MAG: hypothetical protein DRJ13_11750 [Bacteroidota bacterium]